MNIRIRHNLLSAPVSLTYSGNRMHCENALIDTGSETPAGISVKVMTVWIIDTGKTDPRFVTAYPA